MTAKSLKAKLLAMVLTVTVMTALMANVYVKAATDSKDGYTGNAHIYGRSTISWGMASGTTSASSYDGDVIALVSGTYVYVNTTTGAYYYVPGSNQGTSSAVISFQAPDGCQSYTMSSYHWAQKGNYTPWSDSTYVSYP